MGCEVILLLLQSVRISLYLYTVLKISRGITRGTGDYSRHDATPTAEVSGVENTGSVREHHVSRGKTDE